MTSNRKRFILLLSAMSAITPLSIDMYLPALPQLASTLNSDLHQIELSISIFLWGFAIGQLLGGALSDRFGRKIIIVTGLSFFTITSFSIVFCSTLKALLILRFLQAFFGGFITVNAAATVRDHFNAREGASIISSVASIMMLAPMLAPLIGSLLIKFFDWHSIFTFLTIYSACLLFFVNSIYKNKEKSNTTNEVKLGFIKNYWKIITHKIGLGYILAGSFASAGLFAFITKAAYIYMDYFDVSLEVFPFFFGANVLTIIIVNRINIFLVAKRHPRQLLKLGFILNSIAGLCLLTHVLFMQPNLYVILVLNMAFIGSLGLVFGNNTACFLDYFPKNAGAANALFGSTRFTFGALIGLLIAWQSSLGIVAPFLFMALSSLIANIAFYWLVPNKNFIPTE